MRFCTRKSSSTPLPGAKTFTTSKPNPTAKKVVARYMPRVLSPILPSLRMSLRLLTPTMMLNSTSGGAIIFSNLRKMSPKGIT